MSNDMSSVGIQPLQLSLRHQEHPRVGRTSTTSISAAAAAPPAETVGNDNNSSNNKNNNNSVASSIPHRHHHRFLRLPKKDCGSASLSSTPSALLTPVAPATSLAAAAAVSESATSSCKKIADGQGVCGRAVPTRSSGGSGSAGRGNHNNNKNNNNKNNNNNGNSGRGSAGAGGLDGVSLAGCRKGEHLLTSSPRIYSTSGDQRRAAAAVVVVEGNCSASAAAAVVAVAAAAAAAAAAQHAVTSAAPTNAVVGGGGSRHSLGDTFSSCCGGGGRGGGGSSRLKMESWIRRHALKVRKMCRKAGGSMVSRVPADRKRQMHKLLGPSDPEKNVVIPGNCAASSEMRAKAYKICREFLSGSWKSISLNDMIFKTVGGGLSNLLYYCSLPETHTPLCGEPSQVLMRMYGQIHGDQDTTTITESIICTLLAERSLGPKLFGVFPGGRLEEYIPAQALVTEQIRQADISLSISRKLARLHALQAPLTKEPTWFFDNVNKWLNVRKGISMSSIRPDALPYAKKLMAFDYQNEMAWLREVFKKAQSPIMFCHNDLQEGNILHMRGNGDAKSLDENLVFIDFEYCAYNYRGFDIANHFCEWAYDYSYPEFPLFKETIENYPSEEQQRAFLEEYLAALKITSVNQDLDPKVNTVEHLLQEVETFTMASHIFWSLWALNSAHSSKINFGYWEYGAVRLQRYIELKERFEPSN